MEKFLSICLVMALSLAGCSQTRVNEQDSSTVELDTVKTDLVQTNNSDSVMANKTDEEWRKELTPEQYRVLRQKGTERPHSGVNDKHFEAGDYTCAGCGETLFSSADKYDAHCGWPSFSDADEGKVGTEVDKSLGTTRTEILCNKCGGH